MRSPSPFSQRTPRAASPTLAGAACSSLTALQHHYCSCSSSFPGRGTRAEKTFHDEFLGMAGEQESCPPFVLSLCTPEGTRTSLGELDTAGEQPERLQGPFALLLLPKTSPGRAGRESLAQHGCEGRREQLHPKTRGCGAQREGPSLSSPRMELCRVSG